MQRHDTEIPGVYVFEPRRFADSRGWFCETWNEREYARLGLTAKFVQDNESCSCRGVVRGLHFQKGEAAQGKLVRVIEGEVLDVAVDVRAGSPTFGKHVARVLSGENALQLWIPRGFAHGFAVLSERAVFAYKCDNFYCPEAEGSVAADDPELAVDWRIPAEERIRSDKDLRAPSLALLREHPVFFWSPE